MTDPSLQASVLALEALSVHYGTTPAVDRVSLQVRPREVVALVGPSGCGKTSLLRAVAGFESPSGGTIRIDGRTVAGSSVRVAPERRQVGMVFQQGALFPHMTVGENVRYGVRGRRDEATRVARSIDLAGLGPLLDRYPDQLSGGQQQLVALARALAPEPRLVLLDEPFASLDASLRGRLRDEVRSILEVAKMTAILVTHDQEEALSVADRVAVMHDGAVLQIGSPREVYERPTHEQVADFIGGGLLFDCPVAGGRGRSALGEVETDAPDGPARLLVRPENLTVNGDGPGGVRGEIVRRRYYGHDEVHEVRLASGTTIQVRLSAATAAVGGPAVRLRPRSRSYRLFRGAAVHAARFVAPSNAAGEAGEAPDGRPAEV